MGRIMVQGQPRQKVLKTPSKPVKAGCDGGTCHPSYVVSINRRIAILSSPGIKQDSSSKIFQVKRVGG
jgi:hypothetical protein